jgi:hypothetical protein
MFMATNPLVPTYTPPTLPNLGPTAPTTPGLPLTQAPGYTGPSYNPSNPFGTPTPSQPTAPTQPSTPWPYGGGGGGPSAPAPPAPSAPAPPAPQGPISAPPTVTQPPINPIVFWVSRESGTTTKLQPYSYDTGKPIGMSMPSDYWSKGIAFKGKTYAPTKDLTTIEGYKYESGKPGETTHTPLTITKETWQVNPSGSTKLPDWWQHMTFAAPINLTESAILKFQKEQPSVTFATTEFSPRGIEYTAALFGYGNAKTIELSVLKDIVAGKAKQPGWYIDTVTGSITGQLGLAIGTGGLIGGGIKEIGVWTIPRIASTETGASIINIASKIVSPIIEHPTAIGLGTLAYSTHEEATKISAMQQQGYTKAEIGTTGLKDIINIGGGIYGFTGGLIHGYPKAWLLKSFTPIENIASPEVLAGKETFAQTKGGPAAMVNMFKKEGSYLFGEPKPEESNLLWTWHATGEPGALKEVIEIKNAPSRPSDVGGLYVAPGRKLSVSFLRTGSTAEASDISKASIFTEPKAFYIGTSGIKRTPSSFRGSFEEAKNWAENIAPKGKVTTTAATEALGKSEIEGILPPGGGLTKPTIIGRSRYGGVNFPIYKTIATKGEGETVSTIKLPSIQDYIRSLPEIRGEARSYGFLSSDVIAFSSTGYVPKSMSEISSGLSSNIGSSIMSFIPPSRPPYSIPPSRPPYYPKVSFGIKEKIPKIKASIGKSTRPYNIKYVPFADWASINLTETFKFAKGQPFKAHHPSNIPSIRKNYPQKILIGMRQPTTEIMGGLKKHGKRLFGW